MTMGHDKLIKLTLSPLTPDIETAFNLVFKVFVPYSDKSVTLLINPNITEYKENNDKPNIKVRQVIMTHGSKETIKIELNFTDKNEQTIKNDDKTYRIKLMNIGKEKFDNQDFFFYEFLVSEI